MTSEFVALYVIVVYFIGFYLGRLWGLREANEANSKKSTKKKRKVA